MNTKYLDDLEDKSDAYQFNGRHVCRPTEEIVFDHEIAWLIETLKQAGLALEKVCKRNDIEAAVLDYYGDCAMVLKEIETGIEPDE